MNLNHMLSARSDFSLGESMLQIEHLVADAKAKGYESVTLMDTMSIHGLVDFTNRCKKAGLKPVIGCRIRVVEDPTYRKPSKASGEREKPNPMFMLKAYVTGDKGVTSLLRLLSKAYSDGYFYYVPRVGMAEVLELEDVLISTGDLFSVWHMKDATSIVMALQRRFGQDSVYAELVPIDTPLFDTLNGKALDRAFDLEMPTLVTYPTFYRTADQADSLEVLKCIVTNTKMDVAYRSVQHIQDFCIHDPGHLKGRVKAAAGRVHKYSTQQPAKLWINGLENIERLVARCGYQFAKHPVSLPKMADNEFVALGKKCIEGWKRRFGTPILGHQPSAAEFDQYRERLQYELAVLKKMGFSGYFLLVEDLVTWAKANGIIVGPGRGSVGGSLVAYLVGITDVDPIRFKLLFERFINPERQDLPDADLDFMSSKRHMVIEYLTTKYGADRVAGISNYSTLASASALRDAGRMFGLNGIELTATKLVPKEHGQSFSLTDAAKAVPEIELFRDEHPDVWKHALNLEGAMRAHGRHAAGVVVAGEPLVNRAVVETRSEAPVTNWDKRTVEDWGLVKMDILGLSTLDVMEIAKGFIRDRHGIEVDYLALPFEESAVMEAFGRGDTTGVFQFESPGMKKLLRDLASGGQLTFEDITAATALYRPGPMDSGLLDDFVAIKKGHRDASYDHPNMKAALETTFGVIIYQEQVMQVAVDLAGFTRAEADNLRKAMGKKDKDKMSEMRQKWVDGCVTHSGTDERFAGIIFDKIEAFAGYGFNRSHAVEYSLISYFTMWLRVHYPAEYFAACMSIVAEDKLPGLVKDARECGIEVMPPDVNVSSHHFTIPDDKTILAPFSAVKGCSENTALKIVAMRDAAGGKFKDKADFSAHAKVAKSGVNVRVVENLDRVGAFARLDATTPSPKHFSRRKDQMELMPGLIIDAVKADRTTDLTEKFLRAKIIHVIQDYKKCSDCSLADAPHPGVRAKSTVKFMVVADCPTWQEEKKDKLLEGDAAEYVKEAIKRAGLNVSDGYYTTLVKAKKSDKFLTNEQLNGCAKHLNRELELIKPAIIVALGSATIKRFVPGIKGGTAELVGKTFFDPTLDATVVCGINAQQIGFDPTKQDQLDEVFRQVADILS